MNPISRSRSPFGRAVPRIAGPVFLVAGISLAGPAGAQSAASSIDQPTPGTLPSGAATVKGAGNVRHESTGQVASPSAIQSSTDVMQPEGSVKGGKTDPIKHLPKDMR